MALSETLVPVRVELGRAWVQIGDLNELTCGDVIRLERAADAPLDVLVGNRLFLKARPGKLRRRLAVEVTANAEASHR
jgi:flagellar motor switch protein FliM